MLNLAFFRNRRFSAASGAVTLTFFALFGTLFLLSQYMQSVMGYTAFQSGVRYLPLAATLLVISPQSAKLAARFGSKVVVAAGLTTVAGGMLLLLRLSTTSGYGAVLASLVVRGRRDGPDDGTGNGIHHGFAPPGAGRRRFGGERHDP